MVKTTGIKPYIVTQKSRCLSQRISLQLKIYIHTVGSNFKESFLWCLVPEKSNKVLYLITHISKTSPADKRNENPLIKYSKGLKCNPVVIIAAKESLKGFDAVGL